MHDNDMRAAWLKQLAIGICHEKVEPREAPKVISASKTFKKAKTFDEIKGHITICILDLINRLQEN